MSGRGVEYVRRYEFPAELGRKLGEARPDLSPGDLDRVIEALRDFLAACALAEPTPWAPLAIPSTVADKAWQQFVLLTSDYREFCRQAYGGVLHREVVEHSRADGAVDRTCAALASLASPRTPATTAAPDALLLLDSALPPSRSGAPTGTIAVAAVDGRVRPGQTLEEHEGLRNAAGVVGLFVWIGVSLWATELARDDWGWLVIAAVIFIPLGAALLTHQLLPTIQHTRRVRIILEYDFPAGVTAELRRRHPQLTDGDLSAVLAALRTYFLACLGNIEAGSQRPVGMPSRVVDDAWHAFVVDTRAYEDFCRRAFGAYLHHTPRNEMQVPMLDALANTVRRLRSMPTCDGTAVFVHRGGHRRQGVETAALTATALPTLFAIDSALGSPDGYAYDETAGAEILERSFEIARMPEPGIASAGRIGTGDGPAQWGSLGDGGSVGGSFGGGCGGGCGGGGGG
jgi:hypothetical protein